MIMSDVDVSVDNRLFYISLVLMITARTVDQGTIEEMVREFAKVINDFDRAVNGEALGRIKEAGEHLFLTMVHSQLLRYRVGASASAAQTCRYKLRPGFLLYGRHPRIHHQKSHRLGDQKTGAGEEQYMLDLRLARDRENVVS